MKKIETVPGLVQSFHESLMTKELRKFFLLHASPLPLQKKKRKKKNKKDPSDEKHVICTLSVALLKLVSAIFYQSFIFHQMIAPEKLWKMFFISSEKLFSFSRYLDFCIFVFPSFFPVSHWFRGWFKKNLKVFDVINFLNKNLITNYIWHLEKERRCDIET